jgi:hypothetical protein
MGFLAIAMSLGVAAVAAAAQDAPAVSVTPTATTEPATAPAVSVPATEPENAFVPTAQNRPTVTSNGADLIGPAGQTIDAEGPFQSPVEFSFTAAYMYGSVRGFAQVPKGGHIGTTNYQRPQFHSVGISTANIADFELGAKWHNYGEFYVGYQYIPLNGAAFIGPKTLTTAGITYPASSHVASDIDLSWYRFGYRFPFVLSTARNGVPDVVLSPSFEVTLWTFDYNLTVAKQRTANRSFDQLGFQVGGTIMWRPEGGPLSMEATLGSFPQLPNYATISVESLYLRYRFYDWRRFGFSGLIGVTWEQQDFHDRQSLSNHISADMGPLLTVGLQAQF